MNRRRWWTALALLGVAVAVVFAMFRFRGSGFRWDLFLGTLSSVRAGWLSLAVALILASYVIRALRWRILLRPLCPHARLWPVLSATIIGFTAVTLFGRPGELVRPWLIAAREKVPVSSQLAAWMLERIYDLLMVLLIFGYALAHLPEDTTGFAPAVQWVIRTGGYVAGIIGLVTVAVLVASARFTDVTRARLTAALAFLPEHAHRRADRLIETFTSGMAASRSGRQVALLLGWSVVEWAVIASATMTLFRAFAPTAALGWIDTMVFVGFVAFGSIVQIPGVGGGMQVAGAIALTEFMGLDLESATGVAIAYWLLCFVVVIPIGFALMLHEGIRLGTLRQIEENAAQAQVLPETADKGV